MSEISLTRIVNLVAELKQRIGKYRDKLVKNEMLVRYILVDPFLRSLGWNLGDPEQVEPEYTVESGRADYAIKLNGRVVAYIEAKPLGGIGEDVIKEKLKYAFDSGVEYTVITDGDTWLVYETFKKAEWRDRKISEWSITREEPVNIVLKSLILANTSAFGKQPEKPILERRTETPIPVVEKTGTPRVEGPINSKKADYLVLKILANSTRPLGRKEIIENVRELVELTEEDLKKTKSGRVRWETRIRWSISGLASTGMLVKTGRNQYIISEKGKHQLKLLEEEILRG